MASNKKIPNKSVDAVVANIPPPVKQPQSQEPPVEQPPFFEQEKVLELTKAERIKQKAQAELNKWKQEAAERMAKLHEDEE